MSLKFVGFFVDQTNKSAVERDFAQDGRHQLVEHFVKFFGRQQDLRDAAKQSNAPRPVCFGTSKLTLPFNKSVVVVLDNEGIMVSGVRPHPDVMQVLLQSYRTELAVFRAVPERAEALLEIGESKRDKSIAAAQHAAMTIVASMILNLDQTLTRG